MMILAIISALLFIPYGLLILYYNAAWKSIPVFEAGTDLASEPRPGAQSLAISVLVPARNEESVLPDCLDDLLKQSYPGSLYEVIVIDDHSTDRTAELVKGKQDLWRGTGHKLGCLSLDKETAGKKQAITRGVEAATGRLIVTTDADCRFTPDWLSIIAAFYQKTGARFVAAPVRMNSKDHPSSGLSVFQTLDFITLQGITGAAVSKGFHSMCNGANLSYTRDVFYEVGGYRGIDQIPSGDDMLLMHKIYTKYPGRVLFLKSPRAIVSTRAETTWHGFVQQRIRWASKAGHYEDRRIFWVLWLVYAVNLLMIAALVASCWDPRCLWVLLILLILKTTIEYPFVRSVAVFFDQQNLMPWFPLLQPVHILYTVIIGWLGQFGSYRWKERRSI